MPRRLLITLQVVLAIAALATIVVVLSSESVNVTLSGPPATASHWYTLFGHRIDPKGHLGKLMRLRVGVMYLSLLALGLVGYTAARARRLTLRRSLNLCPKCSYDLTGNISGICPECGAAVGSAVLQLHR